MDRPVLSPDHLRARIEAALDGSSAEVADTTGGGDHFRVHVVAPAFEGKGPVDRHRLVYAALDAELKSGALHALELTTDSPVEWRTKRGRP
jgi:stress-induced morphogen